jgi:hypothetical protein
VIKQFELIARKHNEAIQLTSLVQKDRVISLVSDSLQNGMPENLLIDASIRQYEESVRLDIEG